MAARFKLDARGQLSPEGSDAQQAFAGRPGAFDALPTGPDWLCFVRSPIAGGKAPSPRVVLAGDASGFPLSDLIAFLTQSRWTGAIRVHAANGERALSFRDGEVRGAASDDPTDRLGEVMVRLGHLTARQLEDVLRENPPSKVGRALVDSGTIQAHDLWKAINEQISEIFHAIVLCREGSFVLLDQPLDDKAGHNIQLSTQSLLMDSIRKIDEMAHFRKRIPHGRVYVAKKRASDGKLEEAEDKVLQLANGERTLLELAQLAKLSEFDATKAVYGLLEGGYAQVSDRAVAASSTVAPPPVAPVPPITAPVRSVPAPGAPASAHGGRGPSANAVVQAFNQIFREIRAEVAKQSMDREFLAAANAALSGEALSSSPVLKGLAFEKDGTVPPERLLRQYEATRAQLGSEPVASLKQALSDVMFFLLFQAGELLESSADEDLARRVKELLATLEAD